MSLITIKLNGRKGLSTLVNSEDYRTFDLGSYNWSPLIRRSTIYAKTHKNNKTILLHRLIMGLLDAPRSVLVDHIDHNGLNNYKTNLRIVNNIGNTRNSRKHLSAKNTSAYKGVSFVRNNNTNPWAARIHLSNGRNKYLGHYRTQEEAARSYNEAATEYYGTMAYLNVIDPDNKK